MQLKHLQASDAYQIPEVPETGQPERTRWNSKATWIEILHKYLPSYPSWRTLTKSVTYWCQRRCLAQASAWQYSGWGKNQSRLPDDSISLITQCLSFRSLDCTYSGLHKNNNNNNGYLFFLFSSSILNIMSSLVGFGKNVDKTHRNSCSRSWEQSKKL